MKHTIFLILIILLTSTNIWSQPYPNNEDGLYEDFLTPVYYNTPLEGDFRLETNKFVHFVRQIPFQSPLQDSLGQTPEFNIKRGFGAGIGPGGTGSHHPANDYHVENGDSLVDLYAAHSGIVSISRDIKRYRHMLSITTNVFDSSGIKLGKMVTIYAHIDLDLDAQENIDLDGKFVNKGDLVSKHLYSGTVGGPHLHFEIRYYRKNEEGNEEFYGGHVGNNTLQSSGSWTYGWWNPNSGYGFGNPLNHIKDETNAIINTTLQNDIGFYPNPIKDILILKNSSFIENAQINILDIKGQKLICRYLYKSKTLNIDISSYFSGIYILQIIRNNQLYNYKIVKE